MTNVEYAKALREFANALEGCDVELNLVEQTFYVSCNFPSGKEAERMASVVKGLGGKFEKHDNESDYELERVIGPLKIRVYASHESVCERVTTTETVEVTKWVCPPSILELASDAQ